MKCDLTRKGAVPGLLISGIFHFHKRIFLNCDTDVGHFIHPNRGTCTNKIPTPREELNLGSRDFLSGALATRPPQRICFGPAKLHTELTYTYTQTLSPWTIRNQSAVSHLTHNA